MTVGSVFSITTSLVTQTPSPQSYDNDVIQKPRIKCGERRGRDDKAAGIF